MGARLLVSYAFITIYRKILLPDCAMCWAAQRRRASCVALALLIRYIVHTLYEKAAYLSFAALLG